MNRHGISLNPTVEESRRLREHWKADDALHRANVARARTQELIDENRRLLAEIAELRARLPVSR